MVTLMIDNETYAALYKQAAAHGQSVENWLKSQNIPGSLGQQAEVPFATQMAALFSEIGLTGEESIPEFRGQVVRSPEFD